MLTRQNKLFVKIAFLCVVMIAVTAVACALSVQDALDIVRAREEKIESLQVHYDFVWTAYPNNIEKILPGYVESIGASDPITSIDEFHWTWLSDGKMAVKWLDHDPDGKLKTIEKAKFDLHNYYYYVKRFYGVQKDEPIGTIASNDPENNKIVLNIGHNVKYHSLGFMDGEKENFKKLSSLFEEMDNLSVSVNDGKMQLDGEISDDYGSFVKYTVVYSLYDYRVFPLKVLKVSGYNDKTVGKRLFENEDFAEVSDGVELPMKSNVAVFKQGVKISDLKILVKDIKVNDPSIAQQSFKIDYEDDADIWDSRFDIKYYAGEEKFQSLWR